MDSLFLGTTELNVFKGKETKTCFDVTNIGLFCMSKLSKCETPLSVDLDKKVKLMVIYHPSL